MTALISALRAFVAQLAAYVSRQPVVQPVEPPSKAQNSPQEPVQPQPDMPAPSTVPESEVLYFDTPQNAWHAVRVLCDRAGLTVSEKNLICACIFQESEFSNNAHHVNKAPNGKPTSTDWGIVQVNDFYHIGPGKDFPSVAYVQLNPEKMVEWMIDMYQAGKLNLWSSYSSGAYKQWLSPSSAMWSLAR